MNLTQPSYNNVDNMNSQTDRYNELHLHESNFSNLRREKRNDYFGSQETDKSRQSIGSDLFPLLDNDGTVQITEAAQQPQSQSSDAQQHRTEKKGSNASANSLNLSVKTDPLFNVKRKGFFLSDQSTIERSDSTERMNSNKLDDSFSFSDQDEFYDIIEPEDNQPLNATTKADSDEEIDIPSEPDFSMSDLPIFSKHPPIFEEKPQNDDTITEKSEERTQSNDTTTVEQNEDISSNDNAGNKEQEASSPYAFVTEEIDLDDFVSSSDEGEELSRHTVPSDSQRKISTMQNKVDKPDLAALPMSVDNDNPTAPTIVNEESKFTIPTSNIAYERNALKPPKADSSFTTDMDQLSLAENVERETLRAMDLDNVNDNISVSNPATAIPSPSTSTTSVSSSNTIQPKRISLRQRNERQLRPYSYDYAQYRQLLSRSRLAKKHSKARRKQSSENGNDESDEEDDETSAMMSQLAVGLEENEDDTLSSQYIPGDDNTLNMEDDEEVVDFGEDELPTQKSATKYGLDTLILPSTLLNNSNLSKTDQQHHNRRSKGKERAIEGLSITGRRLDENVDSRRSAKRSGAFAVKKKRKGRIVTTFTNQPSTHRRLTTAPEQPFSRDIFSFELFNSHMQSNRSAAGPSSILFPSKNHSSSNPQIDRDEEQDTDSASLHSKEDDDDENYIPETQLPLPIPRIRKRRYWELDSSDEEAENDQERNADQNDESSTIWDYPAMGDEDNSTDDGDGNNDSYLLYTSDSKIPKAVKDVNYRRLISDLVNKPSGQSTKGQRSKTKRLRRRATDDDFIEDDNYNGAGSERRKRPKKVTDKTLKHVLPKSFYNLYKDDIEQLNTTGHRRSPQHQGNRNQQRNRSTGSDANNSADTLSTTRAIQPTQSGRRERDVEDFAAFLGSQSDEEERAHIEDEYGNAYHFSDDELNDKDRMMEEGHPVLEDGYPILEDDSPTTVSNYPHSSTDPANRPWPRFSSRTTTLRINEYFPADKQQRGNGARKEQRSDLEKYFRELEAQQQRADGESVESNTTYTRMLQRREAEKTMRRARTAVSMPRARESNSSNSGRAGGSRAHYKTQHPRPYSSSSNSKHANAGLTSPRGMSMARTTSANGSTPRNKKSRRQKRTRDDIYIHKPQSIRFDRSGQAPDGAGFNQIPQRQYHNFDQSTASLRGSKAVAVDDIYVGTHHAKHYYRSETLNFETLYKVQTLTNVAQRAKHTHARQRVMAQLPWKLNNNSVYLAKGLHLPLLSTTQQHHIEPTSTAAFFTKYKPLYSGTFQIFNKQVLWINIIPQERSLIDGFFFKLSQDITQLFDLFHSSFSEQAMDVDNVEATSPITNSPMIAREDEYDHFYTFVSICLSLMIPHHPAETRKQLVSIFLRHIRGLAWQIERLVDAERQRQEAAAQHTHTIVNQARAPQQNVFCNLPWLRPVIKLMLYVLDWTCRLQQLEMHHVSEWSVTHATQILINILVSIGDEDYGLKKKKIPSIPLINNSSATGTPSTSIQRKAQQQPLDSAKHPSTTHNNNDETGEARKDYLIEAWIFILYLVSISSTMPDLGYQFDGQVLIEQIGDSILHKSKQSKTFEYAKRRTKRKWAETLNLIIDRYMV